MLLKQLLCCSISTRAFDYEWQTLHFRVLRPRLTENPPRKFTGNSSSYQEVMAGRDSISYLELKARMLTRQGFLPTSKHCHA